MDILKITSKFAKGVLNLCLTKIIKRRFGYDVELVINDLDVKLVGDKVYLHIDANAETDVDEFNKILKDTMY